MNMAMRNKFVQQYANNYVETAVTEASPHKLVEMLYDGAVKNLTLTKVFIEQKNYEKKSEASNKALAILNTLKAGVEFDKGGEVAVNLYALYDYCYRRTLEASAKNDPSIVEEVLEHIKELREAWMQMPEGIKRASKDQLETLSV
jgi:flagellar protein FliS